MVSLLLLFYCFCNLFFENNNSLPGWQYFVFGGASDFVLNRTYTVNLTCDVTDASKLTPPIIENLYGLLFLYCKPEQKGPDNGPNVSSTYIVIIRGAHQVEQQQQQQNNNNTSGSIRKLVNATPPTLSRNFNRESSGVQFSNPVLSLVHAPAEVGRKLVRKCELDENLEFSSLIIALIKYPDREDDLAAFVNTVPLWSDAVEVLTFLTTSKRALKHREATLKFLPYFAQQSPWTSAEEDRVLEVARQLHEIFGTNVIANRIEARQQIASNRVLNLFRRIAPKVRQYERDKLERGQLEAAIAQETGGEISKTALAFIEQGYILFLHQDNYTLTKRGAAVMAGVAPSPFNASYLDLYKRMLGGYESIETSVRLFLRFSSLSQS
jgi:hypothetical protein